MTSGQYTNSITVTISAGTVIGNVTCTASNNCGNSTTTSMAVTKKPAVPGAITGPTSTCGQTTATYSIAPVFGATSYTWTLPAGFTYVSGAGTVQITVNIPSTFVYGQVKVSAVNACGNIPGTGIYVTGNVPAMPVTMTGPANVCGLTTATYSVTPVTGATGYNWVITGAGTIVGSSTGQSVTVALSGTAGGTITCQATNVCGSGAAKAMNLSVAAIQPGAITGLANVCNQTTATYSVAAVSGAVSYTWQLAAGMIYVSGQGTNTLVVNIAASTGTTTANSILMVKTTNACGSISLWRSMTITRCLNAAAMNNGTQEKSNTISNLYPNPTSSDFTIDVTSEMDEEITLEVYDILGNLVISQKHQLVSGTNTMNTNIGEFKNGMYFVRLTDGNSNVIHTERVVKQ